MWAIHRVTSEGGDLTAFARSVHGEPLPDDAVGQALRRLAAKGLATDNGQSGVRPLTTEEADREAAETDLLASLAEELAEHGSAAMAGDYRHMLSEIRRTRPTTEFAAFEFPGAGWDGDSTVDTHIPLEEE